jgi:hypothetical protein
LFRGDPREYRVANIARALNTAIVTSEAFVGDVHLAEADELLGGGLDSAPTLGDPDAVAKDERSDYIIANGQASIFGLEIFDLESDALGEKGFTPNRIEVLPPRRGLAPCSSAPPFDNFTTMVIVVEERNYGHEHSFGLMSQA